MTKEDIYTHCKQNIEETMDLCHRLSYLFGTEEYVNMRRGLVLLREELMNYQHRDRLIRIIYVCSGSLGEGVAYPTSDDDLMIQAPIYRVVQSYREATRLFDLQMVPSESSPGYCLLLDVNHSYPYYMVHVIDKMPFLSSELWKQYYLERGEYIHGPCRSKIFGRYEYDYANCIKCSFWPEAAKEWTLRNHRNNWPSRKIMQTITMNGCHVVPIGDQTSSFPQHEWRISFSVAERTLMHSLNHVQFLVYNLLRLCLKRVIEKGSPGVLCSYFIKTTLFFRAENTSSQFWQAGNIETCYKTCLSVLYNYVNHGYCPNYFIPEYNMIKRKVNRSNRQPFLDIIRSLHDMGIVGTIHLCGESKCLDERISSSIKEQKLDHEFLRSDHFNLTLHALSFFMSTHDINGVLFTLFRLLQRYSAWGMANIIFRHSVILCCQKLIDRHRCPLRINKRNYHFHKIIKTLLRIGYKVDVTTGKLTAATYMYLIGKTESALSHIRRLLSEYPPYAIDGTSNVYTAAVYMDVMCGRGYTMDYKVGHAHAPPYLVIGDFLSQLPPPLRIWLSILSVDISIRLEPLSYAYVLESLYYIRLQNYALLKKSTRCLAERLDDPSHDADSLFTRVFIGIIKYEQKDSQSAFRWFGSAYIMENRFHQRIRKLFSVSTMTCIACLLNRRIRTEC